VSQRVVVIPWKAAALVHGGQELFLGDDGFVLAAAGHDEGAAAHREVLAQGFVVTLDVQDADWPVDAAGEEVSGAEEEERDAILHGGPHVYDQCENVGDGYLALIVGIDAAAFEAAGVLDHPEMMT
jgi:hypothetical protein